jgi:hypothetical protein
MSKNLPKSLFLLVLLCIASGWTKLARATPLSGTYTINPSAPATTTNFQNFRSAVSFLTNDTARTDGGPANTAPFGVSGPVVFNVSAGTFYEQVVLDGRLVPGLSAVNTITFDGGTAAPEIISAKPGAVFTLKLCSYVSLRNLKITNTNLTTTGGVYIFGSLAQTNNGTGCSVKRCEIKLLLKGQYGGTGIVLNDSLNITGRVSCAADSVEIDSNTIIGGAVGIQVNGGAAVNRNRHIKIRGNTVSEVFQGLYVYGINNAFDIMHNTISDTKTEGPTTSNTYVVSINSCNNSAGSQSTRIIGNRIDANLTALLMDRCNGTINHPVQMYNNMIRGRLGGISLINTLMSRDYLNIYHNTVYVYNKLTSPNYGGTAFSYISLGQQGGIKCRNNIFAVTNADYGDTTGATAVFIEDTASILNHNVYYNPSGGSGRMIRRNGIIYTTSNSLTAKIGGDSSVIARPLFLSDEDLHLTSGCQFRGVDLSAEVPFDIDGHPRSSTPLAGCDEFMPELTDISVESIIAPSFPAAPGAYNLSVLVRNTGTASVTSFTAGYNANGTVVTLPWTGSLNSCETAVITFSGADQLLIGADALRLKAFVSDPNGVADLAPDNDTIISMQFKGTYTIGQDDSSDFNSFASAIAALCKYGMGGDVVFMVKPGTYLERVTVIGSRISGLSRESTLTFEGLKGADSTIIEGDVPGEALVILQNSQYVTFRGFTVNNLNTSSSAGVAIVANVLGRRFSGTGCAVKQCIINLPAHGSKGIHLTSELGGFRTAATMADSVEIDSNIIRLTLLPGQTTPVGSGSYGIYLSGGSQEPRNQGFTIRNNTIHDASLSGIYMKWINSGVDIMDNTITGTVNNESGLTVLGFSNAGSSIMRIFRNRIESRSTYGMNLIGLFATNPAFPVKIHNNTVINCLTGIYHNTSPSTQFPPVTHAEVYHNSVNVNRTGTGTNTGYAFFFYNALTTGGIQIKNNIFAVTAAEGKGTPVYLQTPPGPAGNINFNNYYNTTDASLLYNSNIFTSATFRSAAGGGVSSVNIKPEWVSGTDLHLTGGCALVGTDLSASVPDDIEGSPRSTVPNLGSYEYEALLNDVAVSAISAPVFPVPAGIQDLRIRITNNGSGVLTAATVSYELNGAAPVSLPWSGALGKCDTDLVIFNGVTFTGFDTLKVYTSLPNGLTDEQMNNDTVEVILSEGMSGIYTIGNSSADFATFAEATAAMELKGLSGPVIFDILSGNYTEQVTLGDKYVNGVSEINTVTYRSAAASRDSVKISFAGTAARNFIFRLSNMSYVSLRHLTLEALDAANARVVEFQGASSYSTIDSCRLISRSVTGGLGTERASVYFAGGSSHYNVFSNNEFVNGQVGIYWYGVSVSDLSDSVRIENNTFSGQLINAILSRHTRNLFIRNNTITASAAAHRAISVTHNYNKLEVSGNSISLSSNGYGINIEHSYAAFMERGIIANNSVYIAGPSTALAYGIYTSSGSFMQYYHNSIHVSGGNATSAAAYFRFTTQDYNNIEVRNNIFSNTSGLGVALNYYTLSILNSSDYNLLYVTGPSLGERLVAYPQPAKLPDLATWRNLTRQDRHSISYRPPFTSISDLRPNPADSAIWAINGRGIHLTPAVTNMDKQGVARPLTRAEGVPDIGAFETTPAAVPPVCVAVPASLPGTWASDTDQVFLFGGDTVARITWLASTTIPAGVAVRQYTGEQPPASEGAQDYMYMFNTVNMPSTPAPMYTVQSHYRDEWTGTVALETDLRVITKVHYNPWVLDMAGTVDVDSNILVTGIMTDTTFLLTGTNTGNPLPVKLIGLSAHAAGKDVRVSWNTASELNSSHFEVQRSVDGRVFKGIGRVASAGYSTNVRQYRFDDRTAGNIEAPVLYYRLLVADKDGKSEYSEVVAVKRTASEKAFVATAFPNPFTSEAYLSVTLAESADLSFVVTDLAGRTVSHKSVSLLPGSHTLQAEMQDLLPGAYILTLTVNGHSQSYKLLKQ